MNKAGENVINCKLDCNTKTMPMEIISKEAKDLEQNERDESSTESCTSHCIRNSFSIVNNDSDEGLAQEDECQNLEYSNKLDLLGYEKQRRLRII